MKLTFGEISKERTKRIFGVMLAFVTEQENGELHRFCPKGLQIITDAQRRQLFVKATLKQLADLTNCYGDLKNKNHPVLFVPWHVETALDHLNLTLGIFADLRKRRQGTKYWEFKLDLWYPLEDVSGNLGEFERGWIQAEANKVKKDSSPELKTSTVMGVVF
jgi:hypothetical protein